MLAQRAVLAYLMHHCTNFKLICVTNEDDKTFVKNFKDNIQNIENISPKKQSKMSVMLAKSLKIKASKMDASPPLIKDVTKEDQTEDEDGEANTGQGQLISWISK